MFSTFDAVKNKWLVIGQLINKLQYSIVINFV